MCHPYQFVAVLCPAQVESQFCLHTVAAEFSEWEDSSSESLKKLRGERNPEGQLAAAAAALQQAGLPDDAVTTPWQWSELSVDSSIINSPARYAAFPPERPLLLAGLQSICQASAGIHWMALLEDAGSLFLSIRRN